MDYNEKEQKGIKKVESMNNFFDKVLMPAIGVLIIITLLSFIVGNITEKFGGGSGENSVQSGQQESDAPIVFDLRKSMLENYEKYSNVFEAYGYEKADGYEQDLALCKVVDEELVIYQFADDTLGDFTILRYTPSESVNAAYTSASLTISSHTLINATVKTENSTYTVAFSSTDFSAYSKDEDVQYNKMMTLISTEELQALYELFEADIYNLAESCGIA